MSTGYICGPMRGYPALNFPAFDRATKLGRSMGFTIISPADMDRESGITEKEVEWDKMTISEQNALIRTFVLRDFTAIYNMRGEDGDFLALLPGWEKSTGATAEVYLARWLKLQFKDAITFLPYPTDATGIPMPFHPRLPAEFWQCGSDDSCGCGSSGEEAIIKIADRLANEPNV